MWGYKKLVQKKNYSRCFIILQQDKEGFSQGSDKLPSGYVKLELRNDKCKISYYVQNLKKEILPYYMLLICNKKELKKSIEIGEMNIDEYGRTDVTYEYPAEDIAGSHISAENISGAAVVKLHDTNIVPVMSGFSGTAVTNWESFERVKNRVADSVTSLNQAHKDKSIFDKYEESIEKAKTDSADNIDNISNSSNTEFLDNNVNQENVDNTDNEKCQNEYENNYNDGRNDAETNKVSGSDDKDNQFFLNLSEEFEEISDFSNEIKRCKWYKVKVNSIETLKNMTDYNKYAVAYYPMLSYYSYIKKYGYFMIGYKFDTEQKIKYIIYGLPGKRNLEDQPFGGKSGFVTWIPDEASEEEMEGCWVMFYDFKTSTVLIPQN
jgi:hypothetical protein